MLIYAYDAVVIIHMLLYIFAYAGAPLPLQTRICRLFARAMLFYRHDYAFSRCRITFAVDADATLFRRSIVLTLHAPMLLAAALR